MIFNDQLSIEQSQQPVERVRRRGNDTQTTMARQLGEDDILVADPPFIKAHWKPHELHGEVRQEWDSSNIEELLLDIGIERQQRIRVLGKMVGAMKFP